MAKSNVKWTGIKLNHLSYVLELLASMLYIIAIIYFVSSFFNTFAGQNLYILASNGFWLPIFYSLALAGTIILFLVSFVNLMHVSRRSTMSYKYGMITSLVTGISWFAISGGNIFLTMLVMISFVISLVGSALGMVTD